MLPQNELIISKKYSEDKDFKKKIYNYLIKYIEPEFKHLKQKINKTFDAKIKKKKINRKQMILSPSDFGFHNNKKIVFFSTICIT